jgi:5'(3')-deoxyribonucleotidase
MPNFTIGLDIDGVVYQWDKTARYMLRRRITERGDKVPEKLYHESDSWGTIEETTSCQDWRWLWNEAIDEGLYRYGHVVTGAIEGVRELSKLGNVVAITSRPSAAVHDTLVWLATFFDKSPLSGLVIQSNGQQKSEVIPRPNVLIDDGIHNVIDVTSNTNDMHAILFVNSANADWRPTANLNRHWRAEGWPQTVKAVKMVKEAIYFDYAW